MRIAISAGHYPEATGASFGDFDEWHESILWASKICRDLGDSAVLVPTGTVRQKVDYINSLSDISMVIEIHFNSDPKRAGEGSETLYYPGSKKGKRIAESIQSVLGCLFRPSRGVKEGWYRGDKTKGVVFFLAKTRCPAVILEPEFVHNKDDIRAKREAACIALADQLRSLCG